MTQIHGRRGRPAKKPGYNRDEEIQTLINRAVCLAVDPFNEDRSPDLPTLTDIAVAMETTLLRARKLLISADYFSSDIATEVQELDRQGKSIMEIMKEVNLGKASVYSYLPYKKGAYNLDEPTLYSEQTKRYRMRKTAVTELHDHKGKKDAGMYLWNCIIAFEGYPFQTSGRGKDKTGSAKFKYEISSTGGKAGHRYSGESVEGYGNEIWITVNGIKREKSISRSTVDLAYKTGLNLMNTEGRVKGPKALGIPGAGSYIYPIFIRFGIITAERSNANGGDRE